VIIGWVKGKWGNYAGGLNAVAAMMVLSALVMVAIGKKFGSQTRPTLASGPADGE
jgi:hypothetical protein